MVVAIFYQYDEGGDSLITFGPYLEFMEIEDEYVKFNMDLDMPAQPDSFVVAFAADYEEVFGSEPDLGRSLYLDDLSFDINTDLDVTFQFEISIFPNPVTEYIDIKGLANYDHSSEVAIYDRMGRLMFRRNITNHQNVSRLDLRDLTVGTYFVGFQVEGRSYFKKTCEELVRFTDFIP